MLTRLEANFVGANQSLSSVRRDCQGCHSMFKELGGQCRWGLFVVKEGSLWALIRMKAVVVIDPSREEGWDPLWSLMKPFYDRGPKGGQRGW